MSFLSVRSAVLAMCLVGTVGAYGQQLTFGVKGGGTLLDEGPYVGEKVERLTVGPSLEYRLWGGFAVEGNLLYRTHDFGYRFGTRLSPASGYVADVHSRAHVLELPVLGKYYFRENSSMQPFVSTGYSFKMAVLDDTNTYSNPVGGATLPASSSSLYRSDLYIGATVGGGVQWKVGGVHLAPELRYTRWGSTQRDPITPKNQLDVLFGVRF